MSEFNPGLVQNFYHRGMEQLDNVLIDQERAKEVIMLGYATGNNVVFAGEPGGGKTTLAEAAPRLIQDITDADIAHIPAQADLAPQRVIGGRVTTEKNIVTKSTNKTESTTTEIDGILKPHTKFIWLDEISRINPHSLNAALGALENGKIITDNGVIAMNGLLMAISTMNPSEAQQMTFNIADATASRHGIGAIMNDSSNVEALDNIIDGITIKQWTPKPVESIATAGDLEVIRSTVDSIAVSEQLAPYIRQLVRKSVDVLSENGHTEAHARFAGQFIRNARAVAAIQGNALVSEEDLAAAAERTVTARFAMKGVKKSSRGQTLKQSVDAAIADIVA